MDLPQPDEELRRPPVQMQRKIQVANCICGPPREHQDSERRRRCRARGEAVPYHPDLDGAGADLDGGCADGRLDKTYRHQL
jgi:hypothetical protein